MSNNHELARTILAEVIDEFEAWAKWPAECSGDCLHSLLKVIETNLDKAYPEGKADAT